MFKIRHVVILESEVNNRVNQKLTPHASFPGSNEYQSIGSSETIHFRDLKFLVVNLRLYVQHPATLNVMTNVPTDGAAAVHVSSLFELPLQLTNNASCA